MACQLSTRRRVCEAAITGVFFTADSEGDYAIIKVCVCVCVLAE